MEFTFVSGDLGLDLAGTVGRRRGERVDLLATPADLARWTVAAGLLDTPPDTDDDDLARAKALREAIYRLASAARTGSPSDATPLGTGSPSATATLGTGSPSAITSREAGSPSAAPLGAASHPDGTAPFDAADLDLLDRAAAHPPPGVRLRAPGVLERTGDLPAALSAVARAAAELLGGPHAALVRECEASPCTRLYVDLSHRRSRRWCDMRGCGNRAKAAAFRARTR
ncbi:CGNR zinc finger domain-containing protein [Streptosporangium sp. NPDC048047]|uniref:CGNR zinc finger domain-containing protein n=1 Tax=Streptosporangium sp. NPDC048047 TaxID=3155748 RepID=UPI00342C1BA3